MSNTTLRKNIYWVGYVDWDVRDFHGYHADKGSTYNSYLIKDEKIALIDGVKGLYSSNLLQSINEHTTFDKINYIICNHAEPDHSGAIPALMEVCKNAEVVCNEKCRNFLGMHYNTKNWKFKIVDESSEISLGVYSLNFINTPMAHWPESMATYVKEAKVLFSMDGFGQHYASSGRFDYDENLLDILREAKKYYANIVMLYGDPIKNVLTKVSNFDIEVIAPSHGVIWEKHIPEILERYKKWTECRPDPKVLIFFDSMWKSTSLMADAIYKGALHRDVRVRKHDLKSTDLTNIATEILNSASIAVGTPTLNKTMMPKVAEVMTYIKGLSPKNKSGIAFGSYGWAKVGGQQELHNLMVAMNINMLLEAPITCQFVPTKEVLMQCYKAGEILSKKALEYKDESIGRKTRMFL